MALCPSCSKLALLNTEKICLKCKGKIYNRLSCICDKCSEQEGVCSICLKKVNNTLSSKSGKIFGGCGSCGKK